MEAFVFLNSTTLHLDDLDALFASHPSIIEAAYLFGDRDAVLRVEGDEAELRQTVEGVERDWKARSDLMHVRDSFAAPHPDPSEGIQAYVLVTISGSPSQTAMQRLFELSPVFYVGALYGNQLLVRVAAADSEALTNCAFQIEADETVLFTRTHIGIRGVQMVRPLVADATSRASSDFSTLHLITPAWDEVCRFLSHNPDYLHRVSAREFELLVAEMFRSYGWTVETTVSTRDGGHDLIAIKREGPTALRLLVEAKRWAPNRPVGVGIVRSLYGLRASQAFSQLVLVTSSYVSLPAKREFQRVIPWELDLIERPAMLDWCNAYAKGIVKGSLVQPTTSPTRSAIDHRRGGLILPSSQ